MWHVSSRSGVATLRTAMHLLFTFLLTRLTAFCPGLPRWAGTSKVKPMWILLQQETVGGSGISWAVCKSAPRSRQTTMPAPHHSVFTGRMPFQPTVSKQWRGRLQTAMLQTLNLREVWCPFHTANADTTKLSSPAVRICPQKSSEVRSLLQVSIPLLRTLLRIPVSKTVITLATCDFFKTVARL